jgi:hypothetical protein
MCLRPSGLRSSTVAPPWRGEADQSPVEGVFAAAGPTMLRSPPRWLMVGVASASVLNIGRARL